MNFLPHFFRNEMKMYKYNLIPKKRDVIEILEHITCTHTLRHVTPTTTALKFECLKNYLREAP